MILATQRLGMLWLLAGVGMTVAPHLLYQPWILGMTWLLLLAWRLAIAFGKVKLPHKVLLIALAFAALATVAALHHGVIGRDAGTALLVSMLCMKLLETSAWRDVALVAFISFFVIVTGFLFSQTLLVALYMLLTVWVLLKSLILFNGGAPKAPSAKLAIGLLLQSLPVALVLFLLFPRLPGPLWGLPEDAFSGKTGLSEQMSPGNISQLSDDDAVAFRAQFFSEVPPVNQRYWRAIAMTVFDGRLWRRSAIISKYNITADFVQLSGQLDYPPEASTARYEITLEPHNRTWLFALDLANKIDIDAELTSEYEIQTPQRIRELMRYDVESVLDYQLAKDQLQNAALYLRVPQESALRARALISQWQTDIGRTDHYGQKIIAKALDYFRQQDFFYTKQPPALPGDPIDQFLFETRRGFCEHYASTFTILMRLAGIPARIVTGYQGGQINTLGDYMIVRQSDAHAWSEVWLPNQGWVRIDPTSVIPANRVEQQVLQQRAVRNSTTRILDAPWAERMWRNTRFAWDNLNHHWNRWVLGYNDFTQSMFMTWLGFENISWQGLGLLLFISISTCLLIIAAFIILRRQTTRDPIVRLYNRFLRKMRRYGLRKQASETALNFARRIAATYPQSGNAALKLTNIYNQLRYAPGMPQSALMKQLNNAITNFRIKRQPGSAKHRQQTV